MSMEPSVVVRTFPDDGTSRRWPLRASSKSMPPAVTPGHEASYRSSKPRPLLQGESSERMSPATMVSPEHDASRLSARPRPSRRRSSSSRVRRIKRTVERQRAADHSESTSAADAIANAFIGALSDLAKSFLYPEAETPKKEPDKIFKKKEKQEVQDVSETVSTVDTDDEGHSLQTYTEEGTADNLTFVPNPMGSSVASSRTPPPPLVGSDGSAFAPSNIPMNVHRPIPKLCRELNSLFPVDEDAKTSPMARMRALPPPTQPPSVRSDDTKSRKSIEDIVAEKHRKWRRQIKMQRRRRREEDDTSLLTTCDPAPSKGHKPVKIFQRPICAPCAQVDDVVCEGDLSFDYDSSSDDSSSTESSVTDVYSMAEESEARPTPRRVALKAPGSPVPRLSSPSLAAESGESEQSGIKDKNFIQIFIQEMSQDGMVLIWHVSPGDLTAVQRPCGVVAYLKLGSTDADGIYESPRLVWRKQDGNDGGDIDLFDIQSVDTASYDMLGPFPFAIPGNSFFVALNNGSHVVFEAGSDAVARRFVHGLRWVVARLSFNLVVGNPLVSCELLSVPNNGKVSPQNPMEEALWSKAMNDVTNRLVDGVLKI